MVLDKAFPPVYTSYRPLRAFDIKAQEGYTGPAEVYVVGPGYTVRTLVVDEQLVRAWLEENRSIIESMRVRWVNRTSPQVVVVLQEFISNSWVHVRWRDMESGFTPGKLALFQDSAKGAAQWGYLAMPGEMFSMTQTVSNVVVPAFKKRRLM